MTVARVVMVRSARRIIAVGRAAPAGSVRDAGGTLRVKLPAVRVIVLKTRPRALMRPPVQVRRLVFRTGVPGPAGAAGGTTRSYFAGETVGGHKAVVLDASGQVRLADADVADDFFRLVGLSLNAALVGASVQVQTLGEITFSGWAWTPGQPVFVGSGGALTQSPSESDDSACIQIGAATAAQTLFVRPERPIIN